MEWWRDAQNYPGTRTHTETVCLSVWQHSHQPPVWKIINIKNEFPKYKDEMFLNKSRAFTSFENGFKINEIH